MSCAGVAVPIRFSQAWITPPHSLHAIWAGAPECQALSHRGHCRRSPRRGRRWVVAYSANRGSGQDLPWVHDPGRIAREVGCWPDTAVLTLASAEPSNRARC